MGVVRGVRRFRDKNGRIAGVDDRVPELLSDISEQLLGVEDTLLPRFEREGTKMLRHLS